MKELGEQPAASEGGKEEGSSGKELLDEVRMRIEVRRAVKETPLTSEEAGKLVEILGKVSEEDLDRVVKVFKGEKKEE